MSFWSLSDGSSATDTGTEYEVGGSIETIPDGSSVLAMPDEAKWSMDRANNEYVQIRWVVLKPEQFANQKIFQKLWITDDDPKAKDPVKKRDKAMRMLMAIDANAGGKLARNAKQPTDDDLALALINKQMVIRLGVWEMTGDNGVMTGNWVQYVGPKSTELKVGAEKVKAAAPAPKKTATPAFDDNEDSDIPF